MRTRRLIALAATFSIAGLAAVSLASATVTSGGSSSSSGGSAGGGGMHGGGGGGGGHGGGGRAGAGGSRGGGGFHGGYGGGAMHTSYAAHGGYVSHGSTGYRIVGQETAGSTFAAASSRGAHGGRVGLALGPRVGSAATATRMDHLARAARVEHTGHGHPWGPGHQPKHPHTRIAHMTYPYEYTPYRTMPCNFVLTRPGMTADPWNCLIPIKTKVGARVGTRVALAP